MDITESTLAADARLGAHVLDDGRVQFRLWAPNVKNVVAVFPQHDKKFALKQVAAGYHEAIVEGVKHGDRYAFSLDGGAPRPDPASRFQPDGVHGASQVVDLSQFRWRDANWKGVPKRDLVVYEMHLGSLTGDGTYLAAMDRLDALVELGVTAIELMPLAQSPGRWNWGYDGVNLFAPRNTYGTPEQLCEFVDACHSRSLAVLLDVVYNHLGPEGNYLREFAPYFSSKYPTPWGEALDFESEAGENVRNFVLQNVEHWILDYHFDGLRLDAIHFLFDDSPVHILQDVRRVFTRLQATTGRTLHLIGEANVFDGDVLSGASDDYDAIWCDCLMHSIYAHAKPGLQLTNREYHGGDEVAEVIEHGYLYQANNGRPRRTVSEDRVQAVHPPSVYESFVVGLQTHDSVGNHPQGKRLHQLTSREYQRAAAPLALLSVGIPQIFMGEEVAIDKPFPFFVDFGDPRLREAVERGREAEYPTQTETMLPPTATDTFLASKCDDPDSQDLEMLAWYTRLLGLRKSALRTGLLSYRNLQTQAELDSEVFHIHYESGTSFLHVACRLSRSHAFASESRGAENISAQAGQAGVPLPIPKQSTIVLCSHSCVWNPGSIVELGRVHALVCSRL